VRRAQPVKLGQALRASGWSWIVFSAAAALLGTAWLSTAPAPGSFVAWVFALTALVSSAALVALLPALLLALAALVVGSWRVLGWIHAGLGALFLLAIYADTVVYGLFRYHLNGMVWNVLTTPGAEDAVTLDSWTYLRAALGGLVAFGLLLWIWHRFQVPSRSEGFARARPPHLKRALWTLVAIIAVDKGLYAWADLVRERQVTAYAGVFPLYQRFTVQRFVGRVLGIEITPRERVVLAGEGILLAYPKAEPALANVARPPNVLLIVIDSLRADMLAPETMPRTSEFARGARTFQDHLSGGNATRYGVFSLLYGIHGAYWKTVLEEQAPPVLVSSLARRGYAMKVLSGPSQNYPEFRSTCWVGIEGAVEDELVKVSDSNDKLVRKVAGDREVARRFATWMGERKAQAEEPPFFCFALIDAPHGSYAWPRENTVFEPVADSVDFLKLARAPGPDEIKPVFNMFRNAVHYADALTGEMLEALRAAGELENTLVLITGDHGEEFHEHGYFGHTSNFAPEQVHVACVLAGPGIPPGVETRPTSHYDVAPTLLELCGADPAARAGWTQGLSLLAPPATRVRALASWDEMALWVEGGILRIPLEGHRGGIEAYDRAWKRLDDEDAFIDRHAAAIGELARECRTFLR